MERIAEGDWRIAASVRASRPLHQRAHRARPTLTIGCREAAASIGFARRATPSKHGQCDLMDDPDLVATRFSPTIIADMDLCPTFRSDQAPVVWPTRMTILSLVL